MPQNSHFSFRVVVGDTELPEYSRDGVYYVECPLDTPFSYMKQTLEARDGETETQMIPVTPYKIKIYARTPDVTNCYRIRIDGQCVSPVSCPPEQTRFSSGFVKDGYLFEYLFSLPKLVAHKDEKFARDEASNVGTISAECWKAERVRTNNAHCNLSFKQAAKQDHTLVTKGLYTMTTTSVGKELNRNRLTLGKVWRPVKMLSKQTLHYRLANDIVDMGFELKTIPFRKSYPDYVLPDPRLSVGKQLATRSSQWTDSLTIRSNAQPSDSSTSIYPLGSQEQPSTQVHGTSKGDFPQDGSVRSPVSLTTSQADPTIPPQKHLNTRPNDVDIQSASEVTIDKDASLPTSDTKTGIRVRGSPSATVTAVPPETAEAATKEFIRQNDKLTSDVISRNESVIILSSEDETEDQHLTIRLLSGTEFKEVNMTPPKSIHSSTKPSTEMYASSPPSQSSNEHHNHKPSPFSDHFKGSKIHDNVGPIDFPTSMESGSATTIAGKDSSRDTGTTLSKSVTETTNAFSIGSSSTSNAPSTTLAQTGVKEGQSDICTDKTTRETPVESQPAHVTSAHSSLLSQDQIENNEPISLPTAEIMDRSPKDTSMDCADETSGSASDNATKGNIDDTSADATKGNIDDTSANATIDAETNNNVDDESTEASPIDSEIANKTPLDENGNRSTMNSFESTSFGCKSESTVDNTKHISDESSYMLKVVNQSKFLPTRVSKYVKLDSEPANMHSANYSGLKSETLANPSMDAQSDIALAPNVKPLSCQDNDLQISLPKRKVPDSKNTTTNCNDKCSMYNYYIKRLKTERDLGSCSRPPVNKRGCENTSGFDTHRDHCLDNRPNVFVDNITANCLLDVDIKKELIDENENRA